MPEYTIIALDENNNQISQIIIAKEHVAKQRMDFVTNMFSLLIEDCNSKNLKIAKFKYVY